MVKKKYLNKQKFSPLVYKKWLSSEWIREELGAPDELFSPIDCEIRKTRYILTPEIEKRLLEGLLKLYLFRKKIAKKRKLLMGYVDF